jgi:Tetratricopeptide repeat
VALVGLLASGCLAQETHKIALDTSETLFTVLTTINVCGYDDELSSSDPLRAEIRTQVARAVQASPDTQETVQIMCQLYHSHELQEASRTLAAYVSLALYLNPPPALSLKVKEADMPPDAVAVLSIVPVMQKFYEQVGLHAIWQSHQVAYEALTERYHEPVAKMLFDTEVYLKLPSAGYLGRGFTVYLDPMGAPGQTNARNYGSDYYVVISPGRGSGLKMEQIRHTYLHYLLDPMVLKYPAEVKRLNPLLAAVKSSPMDEGFKTDASLLVTECMIRAVEARMEGSGPAAEAQREQAVEHSEKQGFVLTGYFYKALATFEKSPSGLRNVYGDMLAGIDVRKELREAEETKFAAQADPEVLHLPKPKEPSLLLTAAQDLSAGDSAGAQKLAQQALDEKREDPGRALFILAQVATVNRDMEGAQKYFQQALEVAREPKVVAWSHIYLGRIFDLQEDRAVALDHYRAALSASASLPEAKAAAERGIQQPYQPAHPHPEQEKQKQ